MKKNIGYHTRDYKNNSIKITGGSFGGKFDQETVERLVNSQFSVVVKPSGACVFVDKSGREVWLYVSVDASETEKGKEALKAYYAARDEMCRVEEEKESQIEMLLSGFSSDEIIERLS